jgi:hypothetical protein
MISCFPPFLCICNGANFTLAIFLGDFAKRKAEHNLGDLNDVTFGSSAIFETRIPKEAQDKPRKRSEPDVVRSVAFRHHLSMGLALSEIEMI